MKNGLHLWKDWGRILFVCSDYPVGKEVAKAADVVLPDVERWAERLFFTLLCFDGVWWLGCGTLGYTELYPSRSSPLSFQELCNQVAELEQRTDQKTTDQVDGILLADDIAYQRLVFYSILN